MRALNLATRPFRNERLPSLLAVVALVCALGVSAYHVLLAREVMPDRTSGLNRKLAEMEAESARLRTEASALHVDRPDAAVLAQWTLLKDLVDRRVFSWSGLFAVLEDTMPDGVRLMSLSTNVAKGTVKLQIVAASRTFDEALAFMRALEDRPEFADVWPTQRTGADEPEYQYDMTYLPQARPSAAPVAAPPTDGPEAAPGPSRGPQVSARMAP